jgi:hypothetical protein
MPDTYISQFSGEEIDATLRAAQIISGADTPAELRKKLEIRGDTIPVSATDPTPISEALTTSGGGVNPNLLDNWYFGRPVNQRGQTSYSTEWGYTIDRWQVASNSTLTINNGSVSLTGDYVFEPLEEIADALKGKTVTVSLLFATGELEFATGVVPTTWGEWTDIVHSNHVGLQGVAKESKRLWFRIFTNAKNILAAKLELGSTQTLAHKEGDKWVLNEIPDYGEQLRRCQRYFVRLTNAYGYGWTYNSSIANFFVSLPTTMRANPVIKLTTNGEIQTINGAKTVTGFEAKGIHPNGFAIDLHNSANALITGTPVTWHSSSMDISADL